MYQFFVLIVVLVSVLALCSGATLSLDADDSRSVATAVFCEGGCSAGKCIGGESNAITAQVCIRESGFFMAQPFQSLALAENPKGSNRYVVGFFFESTECGKDGNKSAYVIPKSGPVPPNTCAEELGIVINNAQFTGFVVTQN